VREIARLTGTHLESVQILNVPKEAIPEAPEPLPERPLIDLEDPGKRIGEAIVKVGFFFGGSWLLLRLFERLIDRMIGDKSH